MGIIKEDEIRGYTFDTGIVCTECVTEEDLKELKQNEVLTDNDIENNGNKYFCDRCDEKL